MSEAAALQTQTAKAPPNNSALWLVQRKCACGGPAGLTGSCSDCEKKKLLGKPVQTKLCISEPGDEYEQEADRVAEQVMRTARRRAEVQPTKTAVAPLVQRRLNLQSTGVGAPPIIYEALSSAGQPLDDGTREFLSARFGRDFANVQIHADGRAAQSAAALNARAYTVGADVVFGAGEYRPATVSGRHLLVHELAHVVQQGGAGTPPVVQRSPIFPDDSCNKQSVKDKITGAVDQSLALVQQARAALAQPQTVARPLKRFFSIEADDRVALFLINENLQKLQRKLAGPVDAYCQTAADYRRENDKAPPRAYVVPDENGRPRPDSPITFNRNIFRLTGATTHRQVVNTVLHEYAHLAGIGHGEEIKGAPMDNENSTKVRGLTTEQAINSAEVTMRFVRAAAAREGSRSVHQAVDSGSVQDAQSQAGDPAAPESEHTGGLDCITLDQLVPPRFPKAEMTERSTLEAYYPRLQGNCFRLLRGGDDSCFGYCLHRAAGGDPLSKGVNLAIPPTIEEFEQAFAPYYEPIADAAVTAGNPPADAMLALFARGETPAHVACRSDLQYQGQYLWESKVSPVFPLILHHLGDLEGGAAGDVVRFYWRRAAPQHQ